jgi:hypothetical protein
MIRTQGSFDDLALFLPRQIVEPTLPASLTVYSGPFFFGH